MSDLKFTLIDPSGKMNDAWKKAIKEHFPANSSAWQFVILQVKLGDLKGPDDCFDCIVSPANSYGLLDGGFDYYISEALAPGGKYSSAVTRIAQQIVYEKWAGYAPPGTCTIVPLEKTICEMNKYGCKYIALCPTMRVPENVEWNKEIVYDCVWSLLTSIGNHNRTCTTTGGGGGAGNVDPKPPLIRSILMTGLGTGAGNVSAERCAQQMVLAMKHYISSMGDPKKWASLDWGDAYRLTKEVAGTHQL